MAEYIDKTEIGAKIQASYIRREAAYGDTHDFTRGMRKALKFIEDMPAADVQPVDEITKIIQARLNGVQKVKIDAMLSGDSTTAYKMVGAETVCIAILQDLEAIKG